ncbi:hypothetical protein F0562_018265 [Nyssa sinensis]|uniref:Uncharacterized protein n=1 Tax=Nyssa sinensis TaxID=561372 RepID=A0A5J4ZBI2_9ASTE|nr:hypothetical protein F0562_018265 [Nyssa sinensis]
MESCRLAMAFTIYMMALMAFDTFRATAALEDVGGIAPSPAMDSAGVALSAPAIVAAMIRYCKQLMLEF